MSFPIVAGIPILLRDGVRPTSLEELDYDAIHNINAGVISRTGAEWAELIAASGVEPGHVLEVGAGTGVLTLGLLERAAVGRLLATDISQRFLSSVAVRAAAFETPAAFVVCDANENHFAPETFDLVLGRSILHHLLDFDRVLAHHHAMLKPAGAAIYLEPVLEGKIVLTLIAGMIVQSDERATHPVLTPDQRDRIRGLMRHQMKAKLLQNDREKLAKVEDKYIFAIDEMREFARLAGFRSCEVINNGVVDPTYWPYVRRILGRRGLSHDQIDEFRWIGDEFAATYGYMFADKLVTPMAYFILRK